MRTTDELGFAEIADILQIPEATAKSRFRYGIEKLRANFIKHTQL
jgi:DNA-directed RNA polymerase specialized sigma24 family protein